MKPGIHVQNITVTGYHFTGPVVLRHSLSAALPFYFLYIYYHTAINFQYVPIIVPLFFKYFH